MFSLTHREQIVVGLVLMALVTGAGIRQLRSMHQLPVVVKASVPR